MKEREMEAKSVKSERCATAHPTPLEPLAQHVCETLTHLKQYPTPAP